MSLNNQNRFDPTPYEWPQAYFDIQYLFAKKIVELNIAPDLPTAIFKYTTIFRRIYSINPAKLNNIEIPDDWVDICQTPDTIWSKYTNNPDHLYIERPDKSDGCHFGSFIYKPYPGSPIILDPITGYQKIELHFNNHRGGGKSEFSRSNMPVMFQNLVDLFQSVANRMEEDSLFRPKYVTLGSWMNVFPGIKAVLPKEFVSSSVILNPPELSFNGDSVWGQFLKNNGGVNQERYQPFIININNAVDMDTLVKSFPIPVLLNRGLIDIFFKHYNTKISW
ncbi:MAG: hypothetical protein WC851_00730 [Candidatus Shapirobacteria bacterium]|jgi:hypothetical protein